MNTIIFTPSPRDGKLIARIKGKVTFPRRDQVVTAYTAYEIVSIDERDRVNIVTVGAPELSHVAIINECVTVLYYDGSRHSNNFGPHPRDFATGKPDGVYTFTRHSDNFFEIVLSDEPIQPDREIIAFPHGVTPYGEMIDSPTKGRIIAERGREYTLINPAIAGHQYRIAVYEECEFALALEPTGLTYHQWADEQERAVYHGRTIPEIYKIMRASSIRASSIVDKYHALRCVDDVAYTDVRSLCRTRRVDAYGLRSAVTEDEIVDIYRRVLADLYKDYRTPWDGGDPDDFTHFR